MIRAAIIFVCAAFAVTAPSQQADAKSVHKEFTEAWSERDNQYSSSYSVLVDTTNASIKNFRLSLENGGDNTVPLFKIAMDNAHDASVVKGRGLILNDLIALAKNKPSPARSEIWMQREIDKLKSQNNTLATLQAAMEGQGAETPLEQKIKAIQSWVQQHGLVTGKTEELSLIDQNLASYHRAKSASDQRKRAARRAFFGILGSALARSSVRRNDFTPTITTHCNTFGGITTCRSN